MSAIREEIDYAEVASSLSKFSKDINESIKIAFDPLNLIGFNKFRDSIEKEMNDIECTPTKEGPTINEVRNFLEEELPIKLQRPNKKYQQKEFHRMNLTVMPNRKDITVSSTSNLSSIDLPNVTVPRASCRENTSIKLSKIENLRTPDIIYRDYKNTISKLDELYKMILADKLKLVENKNGLEKIKKLIEDMKKLGELLKKEDTREAFSIEDESNIERIGNTISQYVFIQEYRNSFTADSLNNESLEIYMNAVNDLLHEITL